MDSVNERTRDLEKPDGPRDCGLFFLDALGEYAPDQVSARWVDDVRPTNREVDRQIDKAWDEQRLRAEASDIRLHDARLCRLIDHRATDDDLTLTLGTVSYRDFVGTNLTSPHLRYLHGDEVLANPLGVSAAVVTSDDFLVLGRRSGRVLWHAGMIHPVGGMVEPRDQTLAPDPFACMAAELCEETGVCNGDVVESVCVGLVRDRRIVQPELIFDLTVQPTAEDIRRRAAEACDAHEHAEMVPVRDNSASVVSFIERRIDELTPVALATLLLHGLRRWGSGWFATARGYLRRVV